MKKYLSLLFISLVCLITHAASFEGVLKIDYKDEAGKVNSAEVFIKGDKYFIKKVTSGCEKYSAYILDVKTHGLTCIDDHKPKTAVTFNADKVLAIYEKNKFKSGYKIHQSQPYKATSATKPIGEYTANQKKSTSRYHGL